MPFDITRFLLNRAVIERQGAPEADISRLAVVPSVIGGPLAVSVATAAVLGQNAAPPIPAPAPTQPPEPTGDVKVPDLTGWRVQDAVDELTKLKLAPLVGVDPRGEDDRVLRTEPVAGTMVATGSEVVVFGGTTGTAPAQSTPEVNFPQMTGWREQDALDELMGLELKATVGTDPRGKPDRVLRTDPAAQAVVAAGSDVVVFTGPPEAPEASEAPETTAARRRGGAPAASP